MSAASRLARRKAQLVSTEALLAKVEADLLALDDLTIERYQLDTGQGTQSARRHPMDELMRARTRLRLEIEDLISLIEGGTVQVVPAF